MQKIDKPKAIFKRCPNRVCRREEVTDFSTCRFCGAYYERQQKLPDDKVSLIESMAKNPLPLLVVTLVIGTVISGLYLQSTFSHSPSKIGAGTAGRSGSASIPAAIKMFLGQKILTKSNDSIEYETFLLRKNPNDYQALVKRGDCFRTIGKMTQAMTDYSNAIAVSPTSPDAYEKRANLYDAMGSYEAAKKDREMAKTLKR